MTDGRPPQKRTLDDSARQRAMDIIEHLRHPRIPEDAASALIDELERLLLFPRVSDLLFWRTPELTDEEVIDEALQYPHSSVEQPTAPPGSNATSAAGNGRFPLPATDDLARLAAARGRCVRVQGTVLYRGAVFAEHRETP